MEVFKEAELWRVIERGCHQLSLQLLQVLLNQPALKHTHTHRISLPLRQHRRWTFNLPLTFFLLVCRSVGGENRPKVAPRKPWSTFTAISWTRAMKYLTHKQRVDTDRSRCGGAVELLHLWGLYLLDLHDVAVLVEPSDDGQVYEWLWFWRSGVKTGISSL